MLHQLKAYVLIRSASSPERPSKLQCIFWFYFILFFFVFFYFILFLFFLFYFILFLFISFYIFLFRFMRYTNIFFFFSSNKTFPLKIIFSLNYFFVFINFTPKPIYYFFFDLIYLFSFFLLFSYRLFNIILFPFYYFITS